MNTEDYREFLLKRQEGLGGSDMPALCHLAKSGPLQGAASPWSSPCDVYLSKVEPIPEEPTMEDQQLYGHVMEKPLREMFDLKHGSKFAAWATGLKTEEKWEERRWAGEVKGWHRYSSDAHAEDRETGQKYILEFKTDSVGRPGWSVTNHTVPSDYYCQLQWGLYVEDLPVGYIWASIHGRFPELFGPIHRDQEYIDALIGIADTFWLDHVIPREMPDPDWGEDLAKHLKKLYPVADKEAVIGAKDLPCDFDLKVADYVSANADIKVLDKKKKGLANYFRMNLKGAGKAITDYGTVSLQNAKGRNGGPDYRRLVVNER